MRVRLSVRGFFGQRFLERELSLELKTGASLADLLAEAARRTRDRVFSELPLLSGPSLLRNGERVPLPEGLESLLDDGDEVAILAPLAGG